MNSNGSYFITGTDTGVGKTLVTALVCKCIKSKGGSVAAMKPIQTGMDTQKVLDIEFVYHTLGENINIDDVCPYRFAKPLSPKLAAEIEKTNIDIEKIKVAYNKLSSIYEHVIVEGAGGILAPIKNDYFIADLICELGLPVIIVARPDLGTINHCLLTIELARNKGIDIAGIIINRYPLISSDAELTNPNEISLISGLPILGIIPEINDLSVEKGIFNEIGDGYRKYLGYLLGGDFIFNPEPKSSILISN